ncbi:MAG: peptidoglycan DD-metalloendopeptidase family protein, partial [Ruminococcus sp.]|nr:peptidoglycan DD-metalloendopeptidase family protein [Ruminococcus sp.]
VNSVVVGAAELEQPVNEEIVLDAVTEEVTYETVQDVIPVEETEEDEKISDYVYLQPDGKAYLCDEDGNRITEACTPVLADEKYYVSKDGYLRTGWLYLGNWKMYFDEISYTVKTGFAEIDGKMYLFNDDGVMQNFAGTTIINGKKYWFSTDNASLKTGWLHLGNWKMYYDPETYEAKTGMADIDGHRYLFNSDGVMQSYAGTPVIDGKKYWFSTKGWLETGWLYLGNWKMYFDPETYEAKTGMADINGKRYLFNSDGVMQNFAGTTVIDGKKYWFSTDDASLKTGWMTLSGMKMYYDPETYQAVTGLVQIGEDYYYFNSDGVMCADTKIRIGYYDYTFGSDGKMTSKEEISMIWPLPGNTYISSYFGYRSSPTAGASTYHQGIDIPAPAGTSILACKSGVVTAAGYTSTRGYYVTINHGNGISACYMHMKKYAVSVGQSVSTGQVIGYVGTTGVSTGNHLHLSVIVNGVNRNPLDYISR